jgi:hypothetical protein
MGTIVVPTRTYRCWKCGKVHKTPKWFRDKVLRMPFDPEARRRFILQARLPCPDDPARCAWCGAAARLLTDPPICEQCLLTEAH